MGLKKNLLMSAVVAVGGVAVTGNAHAAYSYGANAASNTIVAPKAVETASTQAASLVSTRVSQAVSGATGGVAPGVSVPLGQVSLVPGGKGLAVGNGDGKGKASGSAPRRVGVWLNGSYTWIENEQANSNFDGQILNVMGGADYLVSDRVLVGLSGGYENQDIKTKFNNGKLEGDGFTVAPYFAFILNKNVNFDVSVGHSWIDYDVSRNGSSVTGSTTGDRWFGSANANYVTSVNNWQLGATAGYLYTMENQDGYTESDGSAVSEVGVHLGQARLSGKLGYLFPASFGYVNPYGTARLEYDVLKDEAGIIDAAGTKANDDKFGVTFGLGVSAGIGEATSINLEGTTTQFREEMNAYGVSGTVRYKF